MKTRSRQKKSGPARELIRLAAADDRPFFGVVSFQQPHPPYRVPEPYASLFDPDGLELPGNHLAPRRNKPMAQDEDWWPWHDVGPHDRGRLAQDARVLLRCDRALIDRVVGDLIGTAKEVGLYDDLHIVVLGDQGSMLGEHRLYDKGPYAYDELMRMPLIIRHPGLAPRVVNRQVSIIDVAPTLAELMELGTGRRR